MTRIYDEWQVQARAEMMRRGWEVEELRQHLASRGYVISYASLRKALNSDGYVKTAIEVCDALDINKKLKETEKPGYVRSKTGDFSCNKNTKNREK